MHELTNRTIEVLADLVSYDTTSHLSNLPIVEHIHDVLVGAGFSVLEIPSPDGKKAGILARRGPKDEPGLVLSAHTDVVPAAKEDWSHDPFQLRRVGDQLIGRGACDMKGFIACVLAWVEANETEDLPVWIALSRDEELGCIGAEEVVDRFRDEGGSARICIVGEPTELDVVTAHKGIFQVRGVATGSEAHSSLAPHAVNAVQSAVAVVSYLTSLAEQREQEGPFDSDFDVPHSTIHTGTIRGGTACNIVPKRCEFEFEYRYLPGESKEEFLAKVYEFARTSVEPAMQSLCEPCGFEFQVQSDAPGLEQSVDDDTLAMVRAAAGDTKVRKVAFATDAGHFGSRGIPTLVCGPGSIENAHKPDESIAVDQLNRYLGFLDDLVAAMQND
jgi:acetylornithine deacetylase